MNAPIVGKQIADQVDQQPVQPVHGKLRHVGSAWIHDGDQPQEDVAGLGDRAVGQHALDVGLAQGHQVAGEHGKDGQAAQQRNPDLVGRCEGQDQDSSDDGETHRLGGRGQVCGDRGGRALVGIRRPLEEGRQAGLEAQPSQHQNGGRQRNHADGLCVVRKRRADLHEVQRAGSAVHQRDTVEHDGRGDGAVQEIFEAGLRAAQILANGADQDVAGDGEELHRHEDQQQVDGADGEAHGHGDEEVRGPELTAPADCLVQVAGARQRHQKHGSVDDHLQVHREGIDADRIGHDLRLQAKLQHRPHEAQEQEDHSQGGVSRGRCWSAARLPCPGPG